MVPVYNVAPYLETCLSSIGEQWMRDLEVVVVDDGSTDGSTQIAERYSERDERFRVVRRENGGLGAARNTGTAHATGEFLSFVDGDDVLPRHAYEILLGTLDRTGSDFASGNIRRLTAFGTRPAPFIAGAFGATRRRTHITKDPSLVVDRVATNKLFRRSFWDGCGLRFPEGVLYEDIPVILPAHYLATAVDMINATVYLWRRREGGDRSITQRRTETGALTDRIAAVDSVSRFLAERDLGEAKAHYDRAVVANDLLYFLNVLDAADDDYRRVFLDLVNDFLGRAGDGAIEQPVAIDRLKWHLVRRRALPELLEVLRFEADDLPNSRPVRRLRRWYGDYPFRTDRRLRIPRRIYRLEEELAVVAALSDLRWEGDELLIEGYAYLDRIGAPDRGSQTVELLVRGSRGDSTIRVPTEPVHRPDLTADADKNLLDLDWSGFKATLGGPRFEQQGAWPKGTWDVAVRVRAGGVDRRGICFVADGPRPLPSAEIELGDGTRMRAGVTGSAELSVVESTARPVARAYELEDGMLRLEGDVGRVKGDDIRLRLTRRPGNVALEYPAHRLERSFTTSIPVPDLLREIGVADRASRVEMTEGVAWDVKLLGKAGARRLTLDASLPERTWALGAREIAVRRSRFGNLSILERTFRPVIQEAVWSQDGALALSGIYNAPAGRFELLLAARRRPEIVRVPLEREAGAGTFAARLTPGATPSLAGTVPLGEGIWDILVAPPGGGREEAVSVVLDHALLPALPIAASLGRKRFRLGVLDYETPSLHVDRDLDEDERGRCRQRRLREDVYPRRRKAPLCEAVLYDSFGGRSHADSPRAIHDELVRRGAPLEHLWVVRDGGCEPPPTATPVRELGREHYEALATSRFVVTNDYWPGWASRRPEQIWLQTWHGAPLKRHGLELAGTPSAVRRYRPALRQRAANWHRVISPAPFATPVFERAFLIAGEIIEAGLPRTDALFGSDAEEWAADVRRRLGLPAGKRVVLYAPTYRDDLAYRDGYRLAIQLDLAAVGAALGDDSVLLVRRHPLVVDGLPPGTAHFARDVSAFPDEIGLLLIADVLITDYSSILFDFAVTGRPIVVFAPDLEAYRDHVRGLSIDLEADAPGPILRTTEEVIEALGDPSLAANHAARRAAFRERYCPLSDGRATARVVDAVFAV